MALLNLDVLYLWIVDLNLFKVAGRLIILFHDVFHMLNFWLLILVTHVVMHRVTDGRARATFVNWEYQFVAFSIYLSDNMVLLWIILIAFRTIVFTNSSRTWHLPIRRIWIRNLLGINLANFKNLALAADRSNFVWSFLGSFNAVRIVAYSILSHLTVHLVAGYSTLAFRSSASSSGILGVLSKRPILHLLKMMLL